MLVTTWLSGQMSPSPPGAWVSPRGSSWGPTAALLIHTINVPNARRTVGLQDQSWATAVVSPLGPAPWVPASPSRRRLEVVWSAAG